MSLRKDKPNRRCRGCGLTLDVEVTNFMGGVMRVMDIPNVKDGLCPKCRKFRDRKAIHAKRKPR